MPRISEEDRLARRQQILDAARVCVLEHGLEAVSMEMIIGRSGLSTGAVYRYFKGKDEILSAAITEASEEISAAVAPVVVDPKPGSPSEWLERLLVAQIGYSRSGVGAAVDVDRMLVAVHGWSYAQTDPQLKATVEASIKAFRSLCVPVVKQWQADGEVDAGADPDVVAQLIVSICLGFVAQHTLVGDASVKAHADALAALASSQRVPAATQSQ
jgi:AcrR family transcriptional regulator